MQEISEDKEVQQEFFNSLFEKMHLELKTIKSDNFNKAESNLEYLKTLLEFEGAGETFVKSSHFFNPTMNGK